MKLVEKLTIKKALLGAGICFLLYAVLEVVYSFTVHFLWRSNLFLITYIPTKLCYILGLVFALIVIFHLRKKSTENPKPYFYRLVIIATYLATFIVLFYILSPLGIHDDNYFLYLNPDPRGGVMTYVYPDRLWTYFPLIFFEGIVFTMIYSIAENIEKKKSNRLFLYQGWNKPIFFTLFVILSYSIPWSINGSGLPRMVVHLIANIIYVVFYIGILSTLGVLLIIKSRKMNSAKRHE